MSAIANNLDPPSSELENEENFDENDLKSFIEAYLNLVPEPTDEQVHELAELLGFEYQLFERIVFSLFSENLDSIENIADEPLDYLLLSFFLLNPEPTDTQIHYLSALVGKTPEEIEETIYSLLSEVNDDLDEDTLT